MSHLAPRCALFGALLSVGLLGCPGNLDDPDRFKTGKDGGSDAGSGGFVCPSENVAAREELIVAKCATAGCHDNAGQPQAGLDLKSDNTVSRLLDVASTGCTNKTLLTADGGGYFFEKLRAMPTCGARMPVGVPLTATEEQCLSEWANHVLAGGAE